ncbi:uncharacterized protein LTHEOB_10743 [Neofusicoccum parvum]|nr:uncharacterized protein LTHEOB_10743 [Neofusicoccum parvum]
MSMPWFTTGEPSNCCTCASLPASAPREHLNPDTPPLASDTMRTASPSSQAQQQAQRAHQRRKSSTASSASAAASASGEPPVKKFACAFEGCGRAFTRSEHLQRHLLNHTAGESTCERCRAHFKRKDLLERHMQRHRQKDEEAGGEGAGVLNTRKRMWKDHEGNIVTKRPNLGKKSAHRASPSSDQHQRSLSTSSTGSQEDVVRALHGEPPISPPISSTHSSQSDGYGRRSSDACDQTADPTIETWVFPPLELSPAPEPHAYPEPEPLAQETDRFWSNAGGLPASSLRNLSDDVPYDDIFNPDTASSFNMPFTTMSNYNWLFDVDLGATAAVHQQFATSPPDLLSVRQTQLGIDFERPMSSMNRSASLPVIDEVARAQVLDVIEAAKPITPDGLYISRNHPLLSLSSLQTYCDLYFTRFNTAYPLIHQPTFDASHVETVLLVSVLLLGATYCEKDAHQMAVCIHDVLRPQIFAHAGFNAKPDLWVLQTILLVECFGKSRAGQKQHDMAHLFHGLLINLIRRSDCQTIRAPFTNDCSGDLDNDWRKWAEAEQKKRLAYLCFMWDVQHAVLFCQSLCMSAFELRSNLPCNQQLWEADSAELWQRLREKQKSPPLFLSLIKAYLTPGGSSSPRNLNALSRILLLHGLMSISWDMKRRDQTSLGLVGKDPVIGDWKTRMSTSYNTWKADFDTYCTNYLTLFCSNPTSPTQQLRREFVTWSTANTAVYHAAHVLLNAEFLDLQIYAGARHILGRPVGRADHARSQRVVRRWAGAAAEGERLRAATAARHAAQLLRDGVERLDGFDAAGLFHYPWCLYLATLTVWAWWHARPAEAGTRREERRRQQQPPPPPSINDEDEDDDESDLGEDGDEDEMVWDAAAELDALVQSMTTDPSSCQDEENVDVDCWARERRLEEVARATRPATVRRRSTGLTAVVARHLSRVRWAVVHDGMTVLKGLVPWRMIGGAEGLGA